MARSTEEGVQRGMHLIAALSPGGKRYLWTVSRVLGKHSVQIISHDGELLMESTMTTDNINEPGNDIKLVAYLDSERYEDTGLIEFYTMEPKDAGAPSG